jgi:hypothetical protein
LAGGHSTVCCEKYHGGDEYLIVVVNDPVVFASWHMGEIRWPPPLLEGLEATATH